MIAGKFFSTKYILNKKCEHPVTIATYVSCSPVHRGKQSLEQHMRLLQPHFFSNVTKQQTIGKLLFEKLCTELLTYFLVVSKFLIELEVQILNVSDKVILSLSPFSVLWPS